MTYRCKDCVYSEIIDKDKCDMKCLKHNEIVFCMNNHCDELILKPFQFVSYLCHAYNQELVKEGWTGADKMAKDHLDKYGFAGMVAPNINEVEE